METLHIQTITSEMNFLKSSVKNFDGLCSKLVGMGVITLTEQDGFKGLDSAVKCTDLFNILIKKEGNNWQKIIRALEESTNDDAAEKLLKTESNFKKAAK